MSEDPDQRLEAHERHFPEGQYTITSIRVHTEEGDVFTWSDRRQDDPNDDGKVLVFGSVDKTTVGGDT